MAYAQGETLGGGHRLRLAAAHHLHFVGDGATMGFKAHGIVWNDLPPKLAPVLAMLRDTNAVAFTELCAGLDDATVAHLRHVLAALARAGVVQVER